MSNGTVLDGELIVTGEDGKTDFAALMGWFMSTRVDTPIQYVVFDVVYYCGDKVRFPLIDSKTLLEKVVINYSLIMYKSD